jgi:Spy/CpxP family protein refolding chaperone
MSHRPFPILIVLMVSLAGAIAPVFPGIAQIPAFSQRTVIGQSPRRVPLLPMRGWLKDLNLSQEQLQKIREIRQQYQERFSQRRQAVSQAQQELKDLMAGNASAEQIRQKFSQVQTLQQQLADLRMESLLAIRAILTPEQRQKLTEVMRQRQQGARDRMDE